MTLPLAHVGHYLWILYVLPVLIVVAGILRTSISERRRDRGDSDPKPGSPDDADDPPAG
jgi:cytochrome c-type biogenesis protein CcmH/NrfF